MILQVTPFSKINLGLEILRKRQDGFHDINTVFLPITLTDKITIEHADGLTVECSEIHIPQEDNLVYKAARMLQTRSNISRGAKIQLHKKIPTGAGLGGGSSDAAFTLIGLCTLWDISPGKDTLHDIAAELGSDVPFFLLGCPAIGSGRGEILQPLSFHLPYAILIVYPMIHISTAIAYSQVKLYEDTTDYEMLFSEEVTPEILRAKVVNSFEESAFEKHPELLEIKNKFYHCGSVFSLMSGSGSSIYGFFETDEMAKQAAEQFPEYQTFLCKQHGVQLTRIGE
ncbi:MAG: 4-(cytidine 5'-diphospho)-2-C-methyl-D-erythritol kinase [Ignavibacteria bacterium]|nr:4-(cytidine 5'-diphospho)-2-C-methyl-D-erythritol kinase [Ignavibacteria bacterium]